MCYRPAFLALLIVALARQSSLLAQESFDIRDYYQQFTEHNYVGLNFIQTGALRAFTTETINFGNPLILFDHTLIKDEFELLGEQSDEYTRIIEEWQESFNQATTNRRESQSSDRNRIHEEAINRNATKFLIELNEVLLPHQIDRINEIQLRMVLMMEMTRLLNDPRFLAANGISNAELATAQEKVPELITRYAEKADQLRAGVLEDLAEFLPPKNRTEFIEKWSTTSYGGDPQLMLLLFQLKDEIQIDPKCPDDEYRVFREMVALPNFNLKINTQLKPFYPRGYAEQMLFFTLRERLNHEQALELLKLDSQQSAQLTILLDEYHSIYQRGNVLYQQRLDEGISNDDAREEMQTQVNREYQLLIGDIRNVIPDDGWSALESRVKDSVTRARGPVVDLLDKERGLSAETQARISERAAKMHERLLEDSKALQEAMLMDFIGLFDEDSAERLKAQLGDPIDSAPPTVDVLFLQLREFIKPPMNPYAK